jgi:asparagine synthase (glutamine-hydrolysing)
MGAIFGVYGTVSDREIEAMAACLEHRGRQKYVNRLTDELFLGSLDDQPEKNVSASEDFALACNIGQINNTELLDRTQNHGGGSIGSHPSALLLSIYAAFGPTGFDAVKGNFAFVLINREKREFIFGRDFFGSVPLYFSKLSGGGIAFATEYKALLCLSAVKRQVDLNSLQHLQCNKNIPPLKTLIKSIHAPTFGGVTIYDYFGRQMESHIMPPLSVKVENATEADTIKLLSSELTKAVKRQCKDNERIGIALSGGIDSISVACILRRLYPEREIHTFTAGNGPDDPEIITASQVAQHIKSIHHEVFTSVDLLKTELRKLIWHLEDPIARSEVIQLFEIGKIASEYVDVLISGQGADSLFGGMPRYKLLWLMKPLLKIQFLQKPLTEFYNRTQLGLKPISLLGSVFDWIYYRGRFPEVPTVLHAKLPRPITLPPVSPEFINMNMARGFQKGQYQDFPKYERCFGASGVQYRSAFCDESLARIVFSISDSLKIRRGVQKYILRKAMKSIVPDELLKTPKYMQTMRHDKVFSDTLDAICRTVLSKETVENRGFFTYADIENLQRRPSGKPYSRDVAMRIWTILTTEIWAQEFLDR